MGNWRRVLVRGTCDPAEVPALHEFLAVDYTDERWGCLHGGGLCGLGNWADPVIIAVGNLGERGYEPGDVAEALRRIIAGPAPSLRVTVDCGDDYEAPECIATVTVGDDGTVTVAGPSIAAIPELSEATVLGRLLSAVSWVNDGR